MCKMVSLSTPKAAAVAAAVVASENARWLTEREREREREREVQLSQGRNLF